MHETNAVPPDLTPKPVPQWDEIQQDVLVAEAFLKLIAADPKDPRSDSASRFLKRDEKTGETHLEQIAHTAHHVACQPREAPLEAVKPFRRGMWELIFDYSENSGDRISPLNFTDPNALLEVLEFAIHWHALATEPLTFFSTRQLARLARVDTKTMEAQLDWDGVCYEPYGVSLREMAEMSVSEQLFWYRQFFIVNFEDATGWLSKFPGFTPKQPVARVS